MTENTDGIEEIQKQILKITKNAKKLQTNYKNLANSLKEMSKNVNFLLKTVQQNTESIEKLITEQQNTVGNEKKLLQHDKTQGERTIIDRENFVPALYTVLAEFKNGIKDFIEIKTVKHLFFKEYTLNDETEFDEWLLAAYWSNEIELISGIGDYAIRDIYDNVYHYIKF
ncbi:MAG: hypothetical protein JW776_03755 [Candidatus Lokiarchaeota archaeon]|nr:hypothetical protein [Candidatus Lokiarchaeota archaeon]